jgi:hypothetical protein
LSLGKRGKTPKRNHHCHPRAYPFLGFHNAPPGIGVTFRES